MYRIHGILRHLGYGFSIALAAAAAAPAAAVQNPAAPAGASIDCQSTPFGMSASLQSNVQPLYLTGGASGQTFEEYRSVAATVSPPPELPQITSVYQADMSAAFSGRPFQKAVNVDLNGDGRDEVVVAFSNNSDVRLGVFERTSGLSPTAQMISQWGYDEGVVANSIDIVAGDFDGSNDGKREMAVSWQVSGGADDGKTRVVILSGDGTGGIANASNATSGMWISAGANQLPHLAAGDFLLDGRDQLVLAAYTGSGVDYQLGFDLIEYAPPYPAALPPSTGSNGIGTQHFSNALQFFHYDTETPGVPSSWQQVLSISALDVKGGDLVDTAAAELVVHLMFLGKTNFLFTPQDAYVLGQRLLHFETTRDANNAITTIALGNAGTGYDSSRLVEIYTPAVTTGNPLPPPAFAAAIVDIDGVPPAEIVTVRAGRDPSTNSAPSPGSLVWWANQAYVQLTAAYQFQSDGLSAGSPAVQFTSTSRGNIVAYNWNFGDNTSSSEQNPVHVFTQGIRTYTVSLTVTTADGSTNAYASQVSADGNASGPVQGISPPYLYAINPTPVYAGTTLGDMTDFNGDSLVSVGVGDINNDGHPELLTAAYDAAGNVVRYVWDPLVPPPVDPSDPIPYVKLVDSVAGVSDLQVLASDFDGNSLHATIGTDCRQVTDKQLRTLTWQPPYFQALQSDADKNATYGETSDGSVSVDQRSGSYTANDISGYLGLEVDIAPFGVQVFKASAKLTASHNWQSEHGSSHGDETTYSINQGANQASGEALVQDESHDSNCYSYNVVSSTGSLPDSGMRMCQILGQPSYDNTDAQSWNTLSNEVTPVQVPLEWIPLQRDWADLALFRPTVSSDGDAADTAEVTDGLFSTSLDSGVATTHPYIEIDLGSVRDISAMRVFPTPGKVKNLWGFRLYASATPFPSSAVPSGAGVNVFMQDTSATEAVYGTWSVWTRDPEQNQPLQARYVRLQYPGDSAATLSVAEIQVFGDTHTEPQDYPDAVCDPTPNDGLFLARVWNPVGHQYQNIEVHGDMMWSGTEDAIDNSGHYPTGVTMADGSACYNYSPSFGGVLPPSALAPAVAEYGIWSNQSIGDSGSVFWNLNQATEQTQGSYTSIDSSTSVGAEFDVQVLVAVAGAAYNFTTGVDSETDTSIGWGSGLAVGGEIAGFTKPAPGVIAQCKYYPRPYAFHLTDYTNSGFRHDLYVTDYTVKQSSHPEAWQRGDVPPACNGDNDTIFANGFE